MKEKACIAYYSLLYSVVEMRYIKETNKAKKKTRAIDSVMSIDCKRNVSTCKKRKNQNIKESIKMSQSKPKGSGHLPDIPTDLHVVPTVNTRSVKDNLAIEELKKVGVIWVTNVIESDTKLSPSIGSTPGNFLFEIRGNTQMFTIGATKLQQISNVLEMMPFVQPDSNVEHTINTDSKWNNRYKIACKRTSKESDNEVK